MAVIDVDKAIINFLFGKTIKRFRKWKLKRYKAKKVKVQAQSPECIYHMHFKLAIRDKDGLTKCDNVFDIQIPASGYFFAKKKLERFVVGNIDVEIIDFEALSSEEETCQPEIKENITSE